MVSTARPRFGFAARAAMGRLVCALLVVIGLAVPAQAVPLPSSAVPHPPPGDSQPTVSFGVWLDALAELLDRTPAPAVDQAYAEFVASRALPAQDSKLKQDYRRLRLLFEALRDGGFWHLRWAVTDQNPSSRNIWQNWIRNPIRTGFAEPSATAECDELSALQGMLARHLKLYNVGLYYPTWNHTIAVWAPLEGKQKTSLIQLPTTQIFLDCTAGFDATTFQTQLKNIERYPNRDVSHDTLLPRARAEWLLHQIRAYAAASSPLWSLIRAKRAFAMGSSMGHCSFARAEWHRQLDRRLTDGDVSALRALAIDELGFREPNPALVLDWLADIPPLP